MSPYQDYIEHVSKTITRFGWRAYLFGSIIPCIVGHNTKCITDTFTILLHHNNDFDVNKFYNALIKNFVINKQIENTQYRYAVMSNDFILDFYPISDLASLKSYYERLDLTIETVYYDITRHTVVDPTGSGIEHLNKHILKTIHTDWNIGTILKFAEMFGNYTDGQIDPIDHQRLSEIKLQNQNRSPYVSVQHSLKNTLLSQAPGRSIQFLLDYFPTDRSWLLSQLIDLTINMHIPMSEHIEINNVFSTKKLQLVDIYNGFFLSGKLQIETQNYKINRLTETMQLLFDAPLDNKNLPYIDHASSVKIASFDNNETSSIQLFSEPFDCPPYGCPPCDPTTCSPACCCCATVDVVSVAKIYCHEQILLSCNEDGSGVGPKPCDPDSGDGCFDSDCEHCIEACELAIQGVSNIMKCKELENQEWWSLPATLSPCECACKSGHEISGGGCGLTCVKCHNLFCESNVSVTGEDCHYNVVLTPSDSCCGSPAIVNWMFVLDISSNTTTNRNLVATKLESLIDSLSNKGALVKFGITVFADADEPTIKTILPFTSDTTAVKNQIVNYTNPGNMELDLEAVLLATAVDNWENGGANVLMLLSDTDSQVRSGESLQTLTNNAIASLLNKRIVCFVVDSTDRTPTGPPSPYRLQLASGTGGQRFTWAQSFEDVVNHLPVNLLPSSCDCLDTTPIKIRLSSPECLCCKDGSDPCIDDPLNIDCISKLPDHCFDIPIRQCISGQDCTNPNFCKQPLALNACGHTIIISPQKANMLCCSDIGLGCDCQTETCDTVCCGPNCPGSEVCVDGRLLYSPGPTGLQQAKDDVWCNCWTIKSGISNLTSNCTHCCCPDISGQPGDPNYPCDSLDPQKHQQLLQNGICCECSSQEILRRDCCECCILLPNGLRDSTTGQCGFATICKPQIDSEVESIFTQCGEVTPIQDFDCTKIKCPEVDEIINGSTECSNARHPSVVILNNGIGLVAYEDQDDLSVIKIKQFKTSVANKLLPNREFNFGRLQHHTKWQNNLARLYFFDPLPTHLLTTPGAQVDPSNPETWLDGIIFKTGPLAKQCFAILPPVQSDSIGNYLNIVIPTTVTFSSPWPSNDDVYDVKWFLFDFEDTGVIGEAKDENTDGKQFIIDDRTVIDNILQLPKHIYNGEPVPVAYPTIAAASNYSNYLENSHFVYVTYQALENNKWNIYLRQIRLSEYERDQQIAESTYVLLQSSKLNIGQVVYKIKCMTDTCTAVQDLFLIKRTLVIEVLLEDGREVYNNNLTGLWPLLCANNPASDFPRHKVFVEFAHNIIADKCATPSSINHLFYNWQIGNEYIVPFSLSLSSSELFRILTNDNPTVPLEQFDQPLTIGDILVYSSSAGLVFYDNPNITEWATIGNSNFEILSEFKGIDIAESILLSDSVNGHSTRPVVKTNYKNNVFVVYESTDSTTPQINIIGTSQPQSSLPTGYISGRNIDKNINLFYTPADFIYRESITDANDGINQSPDMFIDLNDVIHVTWQSNKDKYWEIYYATSSQSFQPIRITNYQSKSLQPSISGSEDGLVFITWHDNRHGNYEIFLAYKLDTRIEPLFQQDPYLASFRNYSSGWRHNAEIVPLLFSNNSALAECYSDIKVNFYSDRLLDNLSFSVSYDKFPFAFHIPNLSSDLTATEYTDLSNWSPIYTTTTDDENIIISTTVVATSPEINTFLKNSTINKFTLPILSADCHLTTIQFRASNLENDSNANNQWSQSVDVSGLEGQEVNFNDLGIDVKGQYQQVRISFTCNTIRKEYQLIDSGDDADHNNLGYWYIGKDYIRIGLDGSDTFCDAYLRYSVDIPTGSKLIQSFIRMKSNGEYNGLVKTKIRLIDSTDVPAFEDVKELVSYVPSSKSDTYTKNSLSVLDAHTFSTLLIGSLSGNYYQTYLRFPVNIPKDSVILASHLELKSTSSYSGLLKTIIFLLDGITVIEFPIKTIVIKQISSSNDDISYIVQGGVSNVTGRSFVSNTNILEVSGQHNPPGRRIILLRFDNPGPGTIESAVFSIEYLDAIVHPDFLKLYVAQTPFNFEPNTDIGNINQGLANYPIAGPNIISNNFVNFPHLSTPGIVEVNMTTIANSWRTNRGLAIISPFQVVPIFPVTFDDFSGEPVARFASFDNNTFIPQISLHMISGDFPSETPNTSVLWQPGNWNYGSVISPNIAALVRIWLDRQIGIIVPGQDNHIGFTIQDNGSQETREIKSFDSGDPPTLNILYARPAPNVIPTEIIWDPANWSQDETILTPDISTLITKYITRPDYTGDGTYLGLSIQDNGSLSNREFYSADFDDEYNEYGSNLGAELIVTYSPPIDFRFSITSSSPQRLCILPGKNVVGTLDLTVPIRIDQLGQQTIETPLPITYIPNNTYFIKIEAIKNDGTITSFGDPKTSVSCAECFQHTETWDSVSCSLFINFKNNEEDVLYYNLVAKFYYDEDRNNLAVRLDTINNLNCFTINDMVPAEQVWTHKGLKLDVEQDANILLWPQLSASSGLLCGITYYVDVDICSITKDDSEPCSFSNSVSLIKKKWKCECESARWDEQIEDAPINIRKLIRWRSSAFGFADSRITETLSNNFNPIIRFRRSGQGIIIYETNRKEINDDPETLFRIYASVFMLQPAANMYASGAQSIISPISQLYYHSDIPICEGSSCFDAQGKKTAQTLQGRTPSFVIDQLDSIFMAIEKPSSQENECQGFNIATTQDIIVHRCGAESIDLFQSIVEETSPKKCDPEKLLSSTFIENSDPVFQKIVRTVRVNNNYVKYHITRNNTSIPVVDTCKIKLTVIGTPESVALRLRNGNNDWSAWYPFGPDIGENTIEIDWTLLPGSGVKTVHFQVSTYAGISSTASIIVISDYAKIPYSIRFFKPIVGSTPFPGNAEPDISNAEIWQDSNLVPTIETIPITAIRPLSMSGNMIVTGNTDYIFLEISAASDYLSQFDNGTIPSPSFDFVQQGGDDQLNIPTFIAERDGQTVFRGKIVINRDGVSLSKDGLAFIIPRFINDCSNEGVQTSNDPPFVKDPYNLTIEGVRQLRSEHIADIWRNDRNKLGLIKTPVVIRPEQNDPYFVFGDPDYWLGGKR